MSIVKNISYESILKKKKQFNDDRIRQVCSDQQNKKITINVYYAY